MKPGLFADVGIAFISVRLLGELASGGVSGFADSLGHIAASLKRRCGNEAQAAVHVDHDGGHFLSTESEYLYGGLGVLSVQEELSRSIVHGHLAVGGDGVVLDASRSLVSHELVVA